MFQLDGTACCSDTAISFHYISPPMLYVMYYLVYHLRPIPPYLSLDKELTNVTVNQIILVECSNTVNHVTHYKTGNYNHYYCYKDEDLNSGYQCSVESIYTSINKRPLTLKSRKYLLYFYYSKKSCFQKYLKIMKVRGQWRPYRRMVLVLLLLAVTWTLKRYSSMSHTVLLHTNLTLKDLPAEKQKLALFQSLPLSDIRSFTTPGPPGTGTAGG